MPAQVGVLLWPLISGAFTWLFRKVIITFLVLTALEAVVVFLMPKVFGFLASFLGVDLDVFFNGLSDGIWWYLNYFRLDYGLPLMISAIVARFLIRRLPVVG